MNQYDSPFIQTMPMFNMYVRTESNPATGHPVLLASLTP